MRFELEKDEEAVLTLSLHEVSNGIQVILTDQKGVRQTLLKLHNNGTVFRNSLDAETTKDWELQLDKDGYIQIV